MTTHLQTLEPRKQAAGAFGVFAPGTNLAEVANRLEQAGIATSDICMVLPENHPTTEVVRRLSSHSDDNAQGQAVLAWLSKFGAVVIRGLGSFVSARQFVSALLSGNDGKDASGTILQSLGVPLRQAQRCANSIANGSVFLFVDCDSEKHAKAASQALVGVGAEEVFYSSGPQRITEMPRSLRKAG